MTYNVSARPLKITVSYSGDSGEGTIEITEIPSDVDPIEIEPVRFGDPIMDINGNMTRKRRIVPLMVSISVIPGTQSEKALNALSYDEFVNGKRNAFGIATSFVARDTVTYGGNENVNPDSFQGGLLIGSTMGYAVSNHGTITTKKYNFVFRNGNNG